MNTETYDMPEKEKTDQRVDEEEVEVGESTDTQTDVLPSTGEETDMDTIREDDQESITDQRLGSAKIPRQDSKAAFTRRTTDRELSPEFPDDSTDVLITELKGPDAESAEKIDPDLTDHNENENEDIFGENEEEVESDEDDEERKWRILDTAEEWDTDLEVEDAEVYDIHDTTGRSKYLRTCEGLGIVPCSYFVRHIQDPELIMKYHGLGPVGTRAVAKAMKDNITVEKLNLEGNWMEAEGARFMAKMLSENDYITHVNMAGNRLGSEGAELMSAMLENNHTLKSIDLSGNFFEDRDAECIADAIEKNRNLQELNLADNKFGSESGEWLGPAIGANDNVVKLDLSWNQIRSTGARDIAAGLKENVRIKECNLSWNGLGSEGGCAILDAMLVNQSLSNLDLTGNRLDDDCAQRAARVLATSESLEILRMGKNPISTTGAVILISALLKNEQSPLLILDLSDIPVEFEFVRIVEELVRKRQMSIIHGPILRSGNTPDDIGKPAIDPHARHPLLILKEHILVNDTRIVTALQKHDPDGSLCVDKEQFMEALDELDIKYWRSQIDEVAKKLDKHRNGTIYYGDFIPPEGPKREPALDFSAHSEAEP